VSRRQSINVVDRQTRLIAVFVILFGLLCFIPLIHPGIEKLVIEDAPSLIAKYFLVITSVDGGVFFIIGGILLYKGILIPYHSNLITKAERARTELFSIIGVSPFFIAASVTIYQMSKNVVWKAIWSFALVYIIFICVASLRELNKGEQKKRGRRD